jgi:hypothetical protein
MGIEPFPAPCFDPQSPAFLALQPSQTSIFPLSLAVISTFFRHLPLSAYFISKALMAH